MDELSNHVSNNSRNCDNFDEDIFDDSIFLENLESFDFKDTPHVNKADAKEDLNVSALCCDEELNGYDKLTGETWIYPTNYPVRDYQFNIIKAAMLKNCLVSLPTGLGKTFIAAVVMYNFYRWYPVGKIIFTAPTRPLVAQQIEACYNIVAMPPKDTIEMTGQMPVNTRKGHWQSKRVFFATPQVIYNDIKSGMCPGDKIRCLVFDEAHKARGNYAYGNIIATLSEMGHKIYRVLALSATPGNKVEDVIHVVKRLHISHLELRTENCLDVKVYSHARKINTVVIELGPELTSLRHQYVEILDGYNRKLKNFNIVQNLGNLSKGRIVMLYKEFQSRERGARHPQHNYIMRTFTLLITLYHGLELLVKHGARVFLNFFDEHPEKTWVQFDKDLTSFFDKLRDQLGVNPLSFDRSILPDGTIPEIPSGLNFGHPKFDKLKDIMLKHFNTAKQNGQVTKAIVFCEYRESVNLVHCLLLQCRPTIVPEMFVGHGSGKEGKAVVSQKQQLRVMRNFRAGSCNTLVCTCVAEEGLDVGAVDLILCFDVSTRSPVRLVQRCGRTGRERNGQVFILVTEGREHTTLLDCMRQSDGLNNRILHSEEVKKNLYKNNPRMVPRDFMPECQQMYITVKKELNEKTKKTKDKSKEKLKGKLQKGQQDLLSMFQSKVSRPKIPKTDTIEEFNKVSSKGRECNLFSQPVDCGAKSKESLSRDNKAEPLIKLSPGLEFQRNLQDTYSIGHSSDAVLLTELLQQKHEVQIVKSPAKKDGDIRVLFSKTTKSIKDYTKSMKDLGINNNLNISNEVLNLLVDLSLENTALVKPCYICLTVCNCSKFCNRTSDKSILPAALCSRSQPVLPDINLIDNMNPELLRKFANNVNIEMDSNKNYNNSLSESRASTEYSSPKVQKIKMLNQHVDYNTEQNIQSNTIENYNAFEDDCLFEENNVFDNIDLSLNLTPIESRPQVEDFRSIKRLDESTRSDLNTGNKNYNPNIKLQPQDTVVTERQEICDDDNIFEDIDVVEDIDIPVKLTSINKSEPPMNPSDNVHTIKRISKSSIQYGHIENNNNKANTELENNTMNFESQEICDNDNIFEDNDVFEDIDIPVKLTSTKSRQTNPPDDVHSIKRIAESTIKDGETGNKNNNANTDLDNDIIFIDSPETCVNDNIFEDNDVFEDIDIPVKLTPSESKPLINPPDYVHSIKRISESTIKEGQTGNNNNNTNTEINNEIIFIDSPETCVNDNIFEDNDVFEDIDIPVKLTPSESKPLINPPDYVHSIKRISESTIKEGQTGNNNNNTNTEINNEIIFIDSPETCVNDNIFEDNVFEDTKMLNDNNNEIIKEENSTDDDIFEDDDILDDIENNVTCTQSKLQLDNVLHVSQRTPESTIQIMEDETDVYTISVLKYFRLNKISDIFQDLDSSIEKSVDSIKENKLSLLPQTSPKYNDKCDDNNQINTMKVDGPSSPSLLSSRSSSPILISQKRKINLSINKHKNELQKKSLPGNKRPISVQEKASMSHLKEPEHRKTIKRPQQDTNEIIVLDSDDEYSDDDHKDCVPQIETHTTIKRKFQEELDHKSESPYFRKKLKLNENSNKPSTVKEKIMAALTSHQNSGNSFHNSSHIHFMTTKSPTFKLKKENRDPLRSDVIDKKYPKCKIDLSKIFQHETKSKSKVILCERPVNIQRQITYNDDDDFQTEKPYRKKFLKLRNEVIKNAKKVNAFLDVEAELSQDGNASADERSDDSAGSLVDFICDDAPQEDIHDIYLQSVKSPIKGVFKVPQLPPLNKAEILSQYVEEDTYEMDSFCVDSHMILNETNEMSELEIAELILKERRKAKKSKNQSKSQKDSEGSPVIRKKNRNIKRQIDSDSEDSS